MTLVVKGFTMLLSDTVVQNCSSLYFVNTVVVLLELTECSYIASGLCSIHSIF